MLDCGRYFFTKEAVFVFLEMMALHKLNTFHWHLSEDQGFRAQIKSKLLLTEIGSYRSHTNFNKRKHEGYYTTEDMKEIVQVEFEHAWERSTQKAMSARFADAVSEYLKDVFDESGKPTDFLDLFLCETFINRPREGEE
jgi:N-acetyl-beta-hexosaminidase